MDFPIESLYGNSMVHCILMYWLYEKFESIKAVLNTGRETHNLEIQYKYNKNTVHFLLYSIQVFPQKKYIDHRWLGLKVDLFSSATIK